MVAVASNAGTMGRSFVAGLAGTAVMTVAQQIEMKLSDRPPSNAPAEAVEKVFHLAPKLDDDAERRRASLVHFGYGTAWGGVRGLLSAAGLRGASGTLAHLGLVMGAAAVMLPRLGLAPPLREWGGKQIAKDLLFHGIYAVATGFALGWLERRTRRAP